MDTSAPVGYQRRDDYFYLLFIYIGFGAVVLLLNTPLTIYLLKTVNKNQKELIVILSLSISDILSAAQFLTMGAFRLNIWFKGAEARFISQFDCNKSIILSTYLICIQMDNLFQLVISLDRLFAVTFPVKYGRMERIYTIFLVTSPFFVALFGYLVNLFSYFNVPIIYIDEICFNTSALSFEYRHYLTFQRILCVLIPSLIYIFIYCRMRLKFGGFRSDTNPTQLSKGMKHLTKTVALITIVSFFFVLVPEIIYQFKVFGGINANYYFTLILIKKILSFFIHTLRHRELMIHMSQFLPRKMSRMVLKVQPQSKSNISRGITILRENVTTRNNTMRIN